MDGTQRLCDALIGDDDVSDEHMAAALVLLASVDDDLCIDPDALPPAVRALLLA